MEEKFLPWMNEMGYLPISFGFCFDSVPVGEGFACGWVPSRPRLGTGRGFGSSLLCLDCADKTWPAVSSSGPHCLLGCLMIFLFITTFVSFFYLSLVSLFLNYIVELVLYFLLVII
jgi:hypothetical protein